MDELRIPGNPHGIEEPHDVLAADEFAMPARGDYGLHLPRDPYGIEEPHHVLAAEEFAMPSGPDRVAHAIKSDGAGRLVKLLGAAALLVLLYAAVRRR
jgi:hypothetical protein